MKLLIHDLDQEELGKIRPGLGGDTKIVTNNGKIRHCIGCFGCWVKTPGACVIRDEYGDMGADLGHSSELIIVSQCFYGGYSPFVKNVLDRSISYIHPYFVIRNGEMHHRPRYEQSLDFSVWFYGEITEKERQTAEKLVRANAINLNCQRVKVSFIRELAELEGQLK
ncbi:flavodoxin family protein [Desulfitobacterium chlororespirans]|uniref:NADPH-dependent FMN reductase n=1 Tax=Desulfitobacterium chlororespirans DSM 11544 TaxID=1121395 RepID=A0A1M7TVE2_9FIRM|nr:flavodoxin family protein [Desulfitobacterium chlororespirans]SHN74640.1 hypothetical protein SAMN02745215_02541 [Desulfitobacterium chlororespirans DSM 11544]